MSERDEPDQPDLALFDVACRVQGCPNADIVLRVFADVSAPLFVCGPCSSEIVDVAIVPSQP